MKYDTNNFYKTKKEDKFNGEYTYYYLYINIM